MAAPRSPRRRARRSAYDEPRSRRVGHRPQAEAASGTTWASSARATARRSPADAQIITAEPLMSCGTLKSSMPSACSRSRNDMWHVVSARRRHVAKEASTKSRAWPPRKGGAVAEDVVRAPHGPRAVSARYNAVARPRARVGGGTKSSAAPSTPPQYCELDLCAGGTARSRLSGASPFGSVAALASTMPDSAVARLGPDALELERVLVSKSANDTRREAQLSGHLCQAPAASPV